MFFFGMGMFGMFVWFYTHIHTYIHTPTLAVVKDNNRNGVFVMCMHVYLYACIHTPNSGSKETQIETVFLLCVCMYICMHAYIHLTLDLKRLRLKRCFCYGMYVVFLYTYLCLILTFFCVMGMHIYLYACILFVYLYACFWVCMYICIGMQLKRSFWCRYMCIHVIYIHKYIVEYVIYMLYIYTHLDGTYIVQRQRAESNLWHAGERRVEARPAEHYDIFGWRIGESNLWHAGEGVRKGNQLSTVIFLGGE